MQRDFTYIDDVVEGVVRTLNKIPEAAPAAIALPGTPAAPYKIYNLGNNQPVELNQFIQVLETCLGKTAEKKLLPMQPGDVPITYADVDDLIREVGFKPSTPIQVGLERFVAWYRTYYQV